MKKGISLLLSLTLLLVVISPQSAKALEEPLPRWSSMSSISASVSKSGNGANLYYNARAYSDTTKIVANTTLYELKSGSYQYVDSWSHTYNTFYGYCEIYRATSGGACKMVTTFSTYKNSAFQESITITRYT